MKFWQFKFCHHSAFSKLALTENFGNTHLKIQKQIQNVLFSISSYLSLTNL